MPSKGLPIADALFTWPADSPQLLGSRCRRCGEYAFPAQPDCRSCSARDSETLPLGNRGILWTWTIQNFPPKPPYAGPATAESFTPYGVGYVEMPCGLRVEARLKPNTPESLRIGMPMKLIIEPLYCDADGNDVLVFAFDAEMEA
ncbi:MAG: Zn-ribbon domain-containing OB-fold protein [Chromatocurvus sp.]